MPTIENKKMLHTQNSVVTSIIYADFSVTAKLLWIKPVFIISQVYYYLSKWEPEPDQQPLSN